MYSALLATLFLLTTSALPAQIGLSVPSVTPALLPLVVLPRLITTVPADFGGAAATPTAPLPRAYHYGELAFFCKVEVRLERAARLPVKFRLGNVNYVDRLEGKGFDVR